jgi:hypothetical protein
MKTKVVFWRYPRKISLLKDLREGYPAASLLRKSMKTGDELEIPSKISLLKDLAEDIFEARGNSRVGKRVCRGSRIVKELKGSVLLSNS